MRHDLHIPVWVATLCDGAASALYAVGRATEAMGSALNRCHNRIVMDFNDRAPSPSRETTEP